MKLARLHLRNRTRQRMVSLDALLDDSGFTRGHALAADEREAFPLPAAAGLMDRLDELLDLLTPRQRMLLLLCIEHGGTRAAEIAGVCPPCVYMAVHASFRKINRHLCGKPLRRHPPVWKESES